MADQSILIQPKNVVFCEQCVRFHLVKILVGLQGLWLGKSGSAVAQW